MTRQFGEVDMTEEPLWIRLRNDELLNRPPEEWELDRPQFPFVVGVDIGNIKRMGFSWYRYYRGGLEISPNTPPYATFVLMQESVTWDIGWGVSPLLHQYNYNQFYSGVTRTNVIRPKPQPIEPVFTPPASVKPSAHQNLMKLHAKIKGKNNSRSSG